METEKKEDVRLFFGRVIREVRDGARFAIDFRERTLRLNGKVQDLSKITALPDSGEKVLDTITARYRAYRHSVPSERSESRRRNWFRALPESGLSDEDMLYGLPREYARCCLELYVLLSLLSGALRWQEGWGAWFWQSPDEPELVILREWVEP